MTDLWPKFIGEKPPLDGSKRNQFKNAFRRLWVAGTLGAFFAALANNIPTHVRQLTGSLPITDSIFDRSLRYGYLLWFLVYFFVSNLHIDDSTVRYRDIVYDVVQSFLSLTSLYFLGFVRPDTSYRLGAYAITNAGILAICLLAIAWFRSQPKAKEYGINRLRWAGALLSGISLLLALLGTFGRSLLVAFLILQLILWALLLLYVRIRSDT